MTDPSIKFEAAYKKLNANFDNCTVKEAEVFAKRIKYFRFDMLTLLKQLAVDVAAEKCGTEPIKATKIEDYAKDKSIGEVIKGVKWSLDKLSGACKDVEDMEKRAASSMVGLKKLAADIDKDLKKRGRPVIAKVSKPTSDIEKLGKQIVFDLKEAKSITAIIKKIPALHRNPGKEYVIVTKQIVKAKPALPPKLKKYNTVAKQKLTPRMLRQNIIRCQKDSKAVKEEAGLALKAAKTGNEKVLAANYSAGDKNLQKLQKCEKDYANIQKLYKKEIKASPDKKIIEKEIKRIVKIKVDAEKLWESSLAEIKKVSK